MAQASDARLPPLIADWDIGDAWLWDDWPDRKTTDLGMDAVARRKSDGRLIAIQCKDRKLDEHGRGKDIGYDDMAKFISISEPELWTERWLVVIGDTRIGHNAREVLKQLLKKPVTRINIEADLRLSLRLIVALHTGGRTRRDLSRTLWEIETAYDEVKTHMLGPGALLHSKTPELVLQELDGLMLARYSVRCLIHETAASTGQDRDRLSFLHAVNIVRRRIVHPGAFPHSPRIRPLKPPSSRRSSKNRLYPAGDRPGPGASSGR